MWKVLKESENNVKNDEWQDVGWSVNEIVTIRWQLNLYEQIWLKLKSL